MQGGHVVFLFFVQKLFQRNFPVGGSILIWVQTVCKGYQQTKICLFGALRRINPCGSLASDCIKLNMMWVENVKTYKIK